jgi:HAD superfamily hydrolase (TIGR01549 family)
MRQRISDGFWRDFDRTGRGLGIAGARRHIWRATLAALGRGANEPVIERIVEHYGRQRRQHQWLPRARQALLTLRDRYKLGLITNGPADLQREKIRALGVDELCHVTLVSEECGRSKPHPEIFALAMRALDVAPAESLMVGDRAEIDILGAHGIGMRAAWVCPLVSPWVLANTPPPWRTIRDVGDLPALLEEEQRNGRLTVLMR